MDINYHWCSTKIEWKYPPEQSFLGFCHINLSCVVRNISSKLLRHTYKLRRNCVMWVKVLDLGWKPISRCTSLGYSRLATSRQQISICLIISSLQMIEWKTNMLGYCSVHDWNKTRYTSGLPHYLSPPPAVLMFHFPTWYTMIQWQNWIHRLPLNQWLDLEKQSVAVLCHQWTVDWFGSCMDSYPT